MAPTPIGINLSSIRNIPPLEINISTNPREILEQIPIKANELTQNRVGFGIMSVIFFGLFNILGDKTPLTSFGYGDMKAVSLSFGIAGIFGLTLMEINYIYNFKHIAIFITFFIVTFILNVIYENKE